MARGFASFSPAKRTAVARKGGLEVQARGTGYQFDSKTGKLAGKKGGALSRGGRGRHASTGVPTHPRTK